MRILIVIHKNTSVLDYILPLSESLGRAPNIVTILYCSINKKQILRDTRFYSKIFKKYNVQEKDFSDVSQSLVLKSVKFLFPKAASDFPTAREALKKKSFIFLGQALYSKVFFGIEKILLNTFFSMGRFLKEFNPDVILYDNRSRAQFIQSENFYKYIEQSKPPVILLPHAPHYIRLEEGYAPFKEKEKFLPDFCRFWIPYKPSQPWLSQPNLKDKSVYVGYPGFDQKWISEIKNSRANAVKFNCLYIGRKFYDKGVKRWNEKEFVTLEYDDVLKDIVSIKDTFEAKNKEYHLVFKAHPSSRKSLIKKLLKEAAIASFEITYEPFYSLCQDSNVVISVYSTSLLIPAMMGISVIVIDSPLQAQIHSYWDEVAHMYSSLKGFSKDHKAMQENLSAIIDGENYSADDIRLLRNYFPEGATDRAIQDISRLS